MCSKNKTRDSPWQILTWILTLICVWSSFCPSSPPRSHIQVLTPASGLALLSRNLFSSPLQLIHLNLCLQLQFMNLENNSLKYLADISKILVKQLTKDSSKVLNWYDESHRYEQSETVKKRRKPPSPVNFFCPFTVN